MLFGRATAPMQLHFSAPTPLGFQPSCLCGDGEGIAKKVDSIPIRAIALPNSNRLSSMSSIDSARAKPRAYAPEDRSARALPIERSSLTDVSLRLQPGASSVSARLRYSNASISARVSCVAVSALAVTSERETFRCCLWSCTFQPLQVL
jgi:hypothetical protein